MLKGKSLSEYEGFAYRLVMAANNKQIDDTKELAEKLYNDETCRGIIKMRKRKKEVASNPVDNVLRNVQKHLNEKDPYKVPSTYIYAYSVVLDCSIDYLYGRTDVMSVDIDVKEICKKTGLSEKAVKCLLEYKSDNDDSDIFSITQWWSEFLCEDSFYSIPMVWHDYASRIVELYDLDKKVAAMQKADNEVVVDDHIMQLLLEDDNHKTLRSIRREKEDSTLGAYHKMIQLIEHYFEQYAEEWAKNQHFDYEEMYYRSEINKRKIIKEQLKKSEIK